MPFYRDSQQFIRDLQRDQATAFNKASDLTPLPTGVLQRSASVLSGFLKINGFVPRLRKRLLKVDEKRHFWLTNNLKKALLANKKALLANKLLCKINANLLKELKEKRPVLTGVLLIGLKLRPRYTKLAKVRLWQD